MPDGRRWRRTVACAVVAAATLVASLSAPAVPRATAATTEERLLALGGAPRHAGEVPDDAVALAVTPAGEGMVIAGAAGAVSSLGDAPAAESFAAALNAPVLDVAVTPTGRGYWLLAGDGGVFTFGDAGFFGSTGDLRLNEPIVAMAATPSGGGYWSAAHDGGVFTFGDAGFFGSTGDLRLNEPIVGMAATRSGRGYWLVARDGGVFTFGDAGFFGSTGDLRLNEPIVGMAASTSGRGYLLVARDGGVFSFGDAPFHGSAAGRLPAGTSATGLDARPQGDGYWILAAATPVRMALAGDVHAERHLAEEVRRGGNPLTELAGVLSAADIAAVNLETPTATGSAQPKEFVFSAPPELLGALRRGGVDVVSLANNHALDHGAGALMETIRGAREAGLVVVGAGADSREAFRPQYLHVRGQTVAFLGLSRVVPAGWAATPTRPGVASAYDEPAATAAVREAATRASIVVVLVHWGVELARCPGAELLGLGDALHAAGADVVAGHHPHVLQGVDVRPERVTAYSLGNFVWYHDRPPSDLTGILQVTADAGVLHASFLPARIGGDGHPRLLAAAESEAVRRSVFSGPGGCWNG